jgi:hypothetical protein
VAVAILAALFLFAPWPAGTYGIPFENPSGRFVQAPPAPADAELSSLPARASDYSDGLSPRLGTAVRDYGSFAGGPDILILEIALPALDPGPYDLEISTVDSEGGGGASVIKRLVVR